MFSLSKILLLLLILLVVNPTFGLGHDVVKESTSSTMLRRGGNSKNALDHQDPHAAIVVVEEANHRELQAPPTGTGVLAGLRPVNPQTDQAGSIYNGYSPSFGSIVVYETNDGIIAKNTNIEAVVVSNTTATIGSVKFELCQFLGETAPPCLTIIENAFPYVMCGNAGSDFFPCFNFSGMITTYPSIQATAYSGKNGTGSVIGSTSPVKFVVYTNSDPTLTLWVVNAITDTRTFSLVDTATPIQEYPASRFMTNINFDLGWSQPQFGGKTWWTPTGVVFNYDNGTVVRNETVAPFACFGNNGPDFFPYTPTLGLHTIDLTIYRPLGIGMKKTYTFRVVP